MLLTPLISVWTWFKKVFVNHTDSAASVAVTITETIKTILSNPLVGFLLNVADAVTGTQLPSQVVTVINNQIPKILAIELSIQGLPQNPTPEQILAFEQAALKAFNVTTDNSKLYTILGAQIYGEIQKTLTTTPGKFADWVKTVEASWLDYQADLKANPGILDLPVGTKLPDGNQIVESAADALKDPN